MNRSVVGAFVGAGVLAAVPAIAGSVVIHVDPTHATTGVAGARLVCTTVPFGQ